LQTSCCCLTAADRPLTATFEQRSAVCVLDRKQNAVSLRETHGEMKNAYKTRAARADNKKAWVRSTPTARIIA